MCFNGSPLSAPAEESDERRKPHAGFLLDGLRRRKSVHQSRALISHLFLRNNGLALHRGFSGRGGPEGSNSTHWLAIFRDLEVIASAGRESLQARMVILAIASVSALRGLRQAGAVGTVLYAGTVCHRLR